MMKRYETSTEPRLTAIAEDIAKGRYRIGFDVDEVDCIGVAVACHLKWDCIAILRTMYSALEDANMHSENIAVAEWIDTAERGSDFAADKAARKMQDQDRIEHDAKCQELAAELPGEIE